MSHWAAGDVIPVEEPGRDYIIMQALKNRKQNYPKQAIRAVNVKVAANSSTSTNDVGTCHSNDGVVTRGSTGTTHSPRTPRQFKAEPFAATLLRNSTDFVMPEHANPSVYSTTSFARPVNIPKTPAGKLTETATGPVTGGVTGDGAGASHKNPVSESQSSLVSSGNNTHVTVVNEQQQQWAVSRGMPVTSSDPKMAADAKDGEGRGQSTASTSLSLIRSVSMSSSQSSEGSSSGRVSRARAINEMKAERRQQLLSVALTNSDKLREEMVNAAEEAKVKARLDRQKKEEAKERMYQLLRKRAQLPPPHVIQNGGDQSRAIESASANSNYYEQLEDTMIRVAVLRLKQLAHTRFLPE
jgi:hypothetical protein